MDATTYRMAEELGASYPAERIAAAELARLGARYANNGDAGIGAAMLLLASQRAAREGAAAAMVAHYLHRAASILTVAFPRSFG